MRAKSMGYREAVAFAAMNGETLSEAYETPQEAAGDIMTFTVAAIFGKDATLVARAIAKKQDAPFGPSVEPEASN